MRELDGMEAIEVFAPFVIGALVLAGMCADPDVSPNDAAIETALIAGRKMTVRLIETLKKLDETKQESINGQ